MNTPIDRKYDIIHTVSLNDNLYSNKPYAAEKVSGASSFSHIVSCIEYSLRKYPHVHTYDRPRKTNIPRQPLINEHLHACDCR